MGLYACESSQISNIVCSEINSDVNRVESTLKSLDLYSLGLRFSVIWNLCLLLFFHFTSTFCSALVVNLIKP